MAKKKITYEIDFKSNLNSLNILKKELQELQNLSAKDLMSGAGKGAQEAIADVQKLHKTITEIDVALEKAFNAKLGTTNISVFNNELAKSGLNLQQIATTFNLAGVQGQNAFRNLTNQIVNNNAQLKQSTDLMTKMSTTFVNTLKWSFSSSLLNQVTGAIQEAYGYVQHLDRSLNDIRIVTGLSADEMKNFAVQANDAAKALGASTTDYTEASLIYFQQGKTSEESQQLADITLKTANVTGQSAAEVSEELTAVWNGYQVTAEEAEIYVDKLAAVAASTASDLEELSTGMSKVASAANAMGVDVDQLNAQIATIISVTRQAPESVGTALKTIYARMGDIEAGLDDEVTLGNYTEKMASLGVNVLDTNNELRNMGEVIDEVGNKWGTMSREQQIALAQIMAGTRQYNNLVALFDNWDMYTNAIETSTHATGTLQEQQDIYMESTTAHLQTLRTTWEDVYDSVLSTELINPALDSVTKFIDLFGSAVDSIGGSESVFIGLGALITKIFSVEAGRAFAAWRNNVNYAKTATSELTSRLEALEQVSNIKGLDAANANFIKLRTNLEKLSTSIKPEQYNQITEEFNKLNQLLNQSAGFEKAKNDIAKLAQEVTKTDMTFDQFANDFEKITQAFSGVQVSGLRQQLEDFNKAWQPYGGSANTFLQYTTEVPDLKNSLYKAIEQISNSDIKARYQAEMQKLFSFDGLDDTGIRNRIAEIQSFINNFINNTETLSNEKTANMVNDVQAKAAQTEKITRNMFERIQTSVNTFSTQNFVTNIMNGVSALGTLAMSINSFSNFGNIITDEDLEPLEKGLQVLTNLGFTIPMVYNAFKTLAQVTNRVSFKELAEVKEAQAAAAAAADVVKREKEAKRVAMSMMVQANQMTAQEAEIALKEQNAVATAAETRATELNTAAKQKAEAVNKRLNASLLSSPYFLVITAVLALAAVIGKNLVEAQQKAREEAEKTAKEQVENTQKIIDAKQQEINAIEEIKKSYEELNEQYKNNEISVEEMRSSLYDLYMQHDMLNEAIQISTASYAELNKQIDNIQKIKLDEKIISEADKRSQILEEAKATGVANKGKSLITSRGSEEVYYAKEFYSGLADIGIDTEGMYSTRGFFKTDFDAILEAYIYNTEEINTFLNEQAEVGNQFAIKLKKNLEKYIDDDIAADLEDFNQGTYYQDIAESVAFNISDSFKNFADFSDNVQKLVDNALSNENYGLTEANTEEIRNAIIQRLGKNSENAEYILKDSLVQAIKETDIIDPAQLQNIIADLSLNEVENLQLNLPVVIKLIAESVDTTEAVGVINKYKQVAKQTDILTKQLDIKTALDDFINTKDIDASINSLFSKYNEITIGTQTFTKEMIDAMNPGEKADFLIRAWDNVTNSLKDEREIATEELNKLKNDNKEGYSQFLQVVDNIQEGKDDTTGINLSASTYMQMYGISDDEVSKEKIQEMYKELNAEKLIELATTEKLTQEEEVLKGILYVRYGIDDKILTGLASQYQTYLQITDTLTKASTIKIDPFQEINARSAQVQTSLEDIFNTDEIKKQAEEFQKKLDEQGGKLNVNDKEQLDTYNQLWDLGLIEEIDGQLKIHIELLENEEQALKRTKEEAEENLDNAIKLREAAQEEVKVLKEKRQNAMAAHAPSETLRQIDEDIAEAESKVTSATEAEEEALKQTTAARASSVSIVIDLKSAYSDLGKTLSDIGSAYQSLVPAVEDYNNGGKLSLSSLETLLTIGSEYQGFLMLEGNQLKINTEAVKQYALHKLTEAQYTVVLKKATEGLTSAEQEYLDTLVEIRKQIENEEIDFSGEDGENATSPWDNWEAPDIDQFQDVAAELERIDDKIKDLQEDEKKLSGEDLIKNLEEQNKLLEDKAKKQEEYVKLLKDEQLAKQNETITLKDKTNNKSTSVTLRGMGAKFDEDGNLLNRVSLEERAVQNVQSHAWTPEQYNQFISALDDYTKATDNWAKAVDENNKIADDIDQNAIDTAKADANKDEAENESWLATKADNIENLTEKYEDLKEAEENLSGDALINHYKTEAEVLKDLNSELDTQQQKYRDLAQNDRTSLEEKYNAKFDEDGNITNLQELMDSPQWEVIEQYVDSYNENLKQARDIGKQINQNRDELVEKEKESINVLDEEIDKLEDERQQLEDSLEDIVPEEAGESLGRIGDIIDEEISKLNDEKQALLENIQTWRERASIALFQGDTQQFAYWLNQINEANDDLKTIDNRLEEIKDTANSVDLFKQLDKTYSVNKELNKIERQLNRMQKAQDDLEGDELIKNLQQQQALLRKEIALMQKKIQIKMKDLKLSQADLKTTLAKLAAEEGLNLSVNFDAQTGEVDNYLEVLSGIKNLSEPVFNSIKTIMDAINDSASDIMDLQDNLEDLQYDYQDTADAILDEQQRMAEEAAEAAKEAEENMVEEAEQAAEEAADAFQEELDRRLKLFHATIDVNIDANAAQRQLDALKRRMDGLDDGDILGNTQAALEEFKSYYGSLGDIDLLTGHVNDIMGEIQLMKDGMTSSLYGTDLETAFDDLANYRDQLMSSLESMQELVEQIEESYLKQIDKISSKISDQISNYNQITSMLEHDSNLVKLLRGDDEYDKLSKYYNQLETNYNAELGFLKHEVDYWRDKMDSVEAGTDEWEKYQQEWKGAVSELNSTVDSAVQNVIDKYKNAVDEIFDNWQKKLTGGFKLDDVAEQWELAKKAADMYLDSVEKGYEIQALENKYRDAINNTDDLQLQKQLNALMEERLKQLREKDKLSQYDIDRANLEYELTLKQMALEESKNNKTTMRLRRDSQGNYRYEYVANEEDVIEKQQELLDLQNQIYELDKEKYRTNLDEVVSIYQEFQNKLYELYADQTLTEEEREIKKKQLIEDYGTLINNYIADNESVRQNLQQSSFDMLGTLYEEDAVKFQEMTQKEIDDAMAILIPGWDGIIQQMVDSFAGAGGLAPSCEEALNELELATLDYAQSLMDIEQAAGISFDSILMGVDQNIPAMQELIATNDELLDKYDQELQAIADLIDELHALQDAYAATTQAALDAIQAAIDLGREAASTLNELQSLSNATNAANAQAEAQKAVNANNGDMRDMSTSSSYGGYVTRFDKVINKKTGETGFVVHGNTGNTQFYTNIDQFYKGDGQSVTEKDLIDEDTGKTYNAANRRQWSFGTGGYTGEWGPEGRQAIVHEKELILNKTDTNNILKAVFALRDYTQKQSNFNPIQMLMSSMLSSIQTGLFNLIPNMNTTSGMEIPSSLSQNVHIDASFPNVQNSNEIEQAINNLVNTASQYVLMNNK